MHALKNDLVPAVSLAILTALPTYAEDLAIVSAVRMGKDRTASTTQYFSSDRARTSNGDTDTIMNYATGTMTVIDNKKKEYYETSMAELSAMFDRLEQAGAGPLGGLLGGKVADVSLQKMEGTKKVAGYDCDHYVLSMGDDMKFDIWAASDLTVPPQYYDASKAPYAAMGPMGRRFGKMFEEMKKIRGFPLSTGINAKMMMLKIDTVSEATDVKKGPLPASAFDVPAGYKKKDSPFRKN